MSKQSKIRWRDSDLQELRRVTKNYNAKITRQRKKLIAADRRYEAAQLPPKKSVKELRQEIGTRRDLTRELGDMQNFIDTGSKVRLDANTKRSLTATVRDFNAKVDRLSAKAKTQGAKAALPEKISEDWIIRNASSKEALQRDLQTYKGFLRRGAEKLVELPDTKNNIKITTWQKETMEQRLVEINEARALELEKWRETEVRYGGKEAGYKQGQIRMDQGIEDEFRPMKMYNWSSEYPDIKEKFKLMLREGQEGYWDSRTELARINYLEKLKDVTHGSEAGQMIYDKVSKLPLEDFRRILDAEDLFGDVYDLEKGSKEQASRTQTMKIWKTWKTENDKEKDEQIFLDALERMNTGDK